MPAAAPQAGAGQQDTGGLGVVWIIAGIFLLLFGVWFFAHGVIVKIFFDVKLFEINVIQFFANVLGKAEELILNSNPNDVTFPGLVFVASTVGYYLRFPAAIILLLMAMILYFRSSTVRFKQTYNMASLLGAVVEDWPQETPTLNVNLVKEDIDNGNWAMASIPMDFAKKNKLLKEHRPELREDQLTMKAKVTVTLIKDRADRVFAMQLGPLWNGVDSLRLHVRALYAAFAARAARQPKESWEFLYKISTSARNGKPDFSGVEGLLKKYKNYPAVVEITNKHAYVMTIMASMLQLARSDGVLAGADFLWLKSIDRRLWFMLNAVGRQTVTVEVAGPYAHWLAEKEIGFAIKTPMIEEATKALDEALKEIIYTSHS